MIDVSGGSAVETWAHTDRLGSVIATTDGTGVVQDTYRYSPYGRPGSEGPTGFPFRFTGQRLDAETGLYYYKARYYDPETGRFLQTDPIGYEDQMNLYAYVGNDPVNGIDPSGLCDTKIGSRFCSRTGGGSQTGGNTTGLDGVAQGAANSQTSDPKADSNSPVGSELPGLVALGASTVKTSAGTVSELPSRASAIRLANIGRIAGFIGNTAVIVQTGLDVIAVREGLMSTERATVHLAGNTTSHLVGVFNPVAGLVVGVSVFGAELAFDNVIVPVSRTTKDGIKKFSKDPIGFFDRLAGLPQISVENL